MKVLPMWWFYKGIFKSSMSNLAIVTNVFLILVMKEISKLNKFCRFLTVNADDNCFISRIICKMSTRSLSLESIMISTNPTFKGQLSGTLIRFLANSLVFGNFFSVFQIWQIFMRLSRSFFLGASEVSTLMSTLRKKIISDLNKKLRI